MKINNLIDSDWIEDDNFGWCQSMYYDVWLELEPLFY